MSSFSARDRTTSSARDGQPSIRGYLAVHHRRLATLRGSFIIEDGLAYLQRTRRDYLIRGRIWCAHGLFLDVKEALVLNERSQVVAVVYGYHAGVEGAANRPIFRYDNAHPYAREGHPDDHHRHRYDHTTWQEIKPPTWVGHDRRPLLSEALEELREWWETTGQHLDLGERS